MESATMEKIFIWAGKSAFTLGATAIVGATLGASSVCGTWAATKALTSKHNATTEAVEENETKVNISNKSEKPSTFAKTLPNVMSLPQSATTNFKAQPIPTGEIREYSTIRPSLDPPIEETMSEEQLETLREYVIRQGEALERDDSKR